MKKIQLHSVVLILDHPEMGRICHLSWFDWIEQYQKRTGKAQFRLDVALKLKSHNYVHTFKIYYQPINPFTRSLIRSFT